MAGKKEAGRGVSGLPRIGALIIGLGMKPRRGDNRGIGARSIGGTVGEGISGHWLQFGGEFGQWMTEIHPGIDVGNSVIPYFSTYDTLTQEEIGDATYCECPEKVFVVFFELSSTFDLPRRRISRPQEIAKSSFADYTLFVV